MTRAIVLLALALVIASCDDPTVFPVEPSYAEEEPPPTLRLVAGDDQWGLPSTPLRERLSVEALGSDGLPIPSQRISWTVTGGGTVSRTATKTVASGTSAVTWTLGAEEEEEEDDDGRGGDGGDGGEVEPQEVVATWVDAPAGAVTTVTFSASLIPATARLVVTAGADQFGVPSQPFGRRVQVRADDGAGTPIPGVFVAWNVTEGGGSVNATSRLSSAGGLASVTWTAGGAGPQTVVATSPGFVSATFHGTATEGPALSSMVATPLAVVTQLGSSTVDLSWQASDPDGVQETVATLVAPSGPTHACDAPPVLASGTPAGGIWRCTFTLPQDVVRRTYEVHLTAQDALGNSTVWTAPSTVAENPSSAPVVSSLRVTPTEINTTLSPRVVTVRWRVATTGGELVQTLHLGPHTCATGGSPAPDLVDGNVADGTWRCRIVLPQRVEGEVEHGVTLEVQDLDGRATTVSGPTLIENGEVE